MEQAYKIREEVFVKEQKVAPEEEYDVYDQTSTHFVAYDEADKPCGTARWRLTDSGIKLERFAVLQEYQNKGIGSLLLKNVLHDIEEDPNVQEQKIYMHVQASAVEFYKRFGFELISDEFMECGIRHFEMAR